MWVVAWADDIPDAVLRRRALALIDARYTDSTLTTQSIATELFVSTRTLYRAFEETPTTVARALPAPALRGRESTRAR